MSDDLVKQLRFTADDVCRCGTLVCLEAADRIEHLEDRCANLLVENGILNNHIEKLEAALTHIYAWYPVSIAHPHQTIKEIREFARKALEGKDD